MGAGGGTPAQGHPVPCPSVRLQVTAQNLRPRTLGQLVRGDQGQEPLREAIPVQGRVSVSVTPTSASLSGVGAQHRVPGVPASSWASREPPLTQAALANPSSHAAPGVHAAEWRWQ